MLGHGIAGKLSARLGEGLLSGCLTARLGLAAMDVVRPLPFTALPRPTLRNLMSDVLRGFGEKDETPVRVFQLAGCGSGNFHLPLRISARGR